MKKVLHISKYYYPFIGGIEKVARDMVNVLREDDVEQKVICFNENATDGSIKCYKEQTVYDEIDGVEIIRCVYKKKISSQSLSFAYYKEFKKVMDNFSPDIVVFHYPNPYVAHILLKYKKRNFKLLLYWHLDITKQKILKKIFYRQTISLIDRASYVIGATPIHIEQSEFSSKFEDKKRILPYMINDENLLLTEEEEEKAKKLRDKYKDDKVCFFIGRHVEYKGLRYLVEASENLLNKNIKILIAGSGELTEELKRKACLDKKIEFLGRINESEKKIYMSMCDIFCFPSITRNEAFGLALAEGMYYGKPAITFSIPGSGVNYVNLNNITGIECENSNAKDYANAIDKLASDDKLRKILGENAKKRIKDNFTSKKFKENVLELFKEL